MAFLADNLGEICGTVRTNLLRTLLTGPQQFEKRFMQVGLSDGRHTEVLSGVEKNDRIKIGDRPM